MAKSLLDWTAEHARAIEVMRANTTRWRRAGLLKKPGDVKIHSADKFKLRPGRPRKAHANHG